MVFSKTLPIFSLALQIFGEKSFKYEKYLYFVSLILKTLLLIHFEPKR
jgi:hypothetical protein